MYKTVFAVVCFVASALAAPAGLPGPKLSLSGPTCPPNLAKIDLGLPAGQTALAPQKGVAPSFALLGVGVQNYTCADTGKYAAAGAVAELFDISCLGGTPLYKSIHTTAFNVWKAIPDKLLSPKVTTQIAAPLIPLAVLSSGKHYFTPTATGSSPVWDMRTSGPKSVVGKASAYVVGAKVAGIPAPSGPQDVDWLQVKNVEGSLAAMIYRTDTVGGQPPSSCKPGSAPISVKYVSKYLLYGSTVA